MLGSLVQTMNCFLMAVGPASLPAATGNGAEFPHLGGYISSWEEKNCSSAFQLLGCSHQLFGGRGKPVSQHFPQRKDANVNVSH